MTCEFQKALVLYDFEGTPDTCRHYIFDQFEQRKPDKCELCRFGKRDGVRIGEFIYYIYDKTLIVAKDGQIVREFKNLLKINYNGGVYIVVDKNNIYHVYGDHYTTTPYKGHLRLVSEDAYVVGDYVYDVKSQTLSWVLPKIIRANSDMVLVNRDVLYTIIMGDLYRVNRGIVIEILTNCDLTGIEFDDGKHIAVGNSYTTYILDMHGDHIHTASFGIDFFHSYPGFVMCGDHIYEDRFQYDTSKCTLSNCTIVDILPHSPRMVAHIYDTIIDHLPPVLPDTLVRVVASYL